MKTIIIIAIIIIFIGCTKDSNKIDSLFIGKDNISLTSKKVSLKDDKISLNFMFDMCYIDSVLIINEFPDPQYCLKLVNLKKKEVFYFAEKGKGPGEMNSQLVNFSVDYNNKLLYLSDRFNYYVYEIDSVIENKLNDRYLEVMPFKFENANFLKTVYNDGNIIGGLFEKEFGVYIIDQDSIIKHNDYGKGGALVNQSFFIANPIEKKVAYFNYLSANMGIINIGEDLSLNLMRIIEDNSDAETEFNDNVSSIVQKGKAKNGYIAATSSNKFLYVLYGGNRIEGATVEEMNGAFLSDRVYVFDWYGNPVTIYTLDSKVRSLAVDTEDQRIYAASYENEPHLIYFDL